MDPPGTLPVFLALTGAADAGSGTGRRARRSASRCSSSSSSRCSARAILDYLHITLPALQGAGGLLLLLVALELLTGGPTSRSSTEGVNVALVPLGTPLLAGPGAIVATMVFVQPVRHRRRRRRRRPGHRRPCTSCCGCSCASPGVILRLLKDSGVTLVTRIAGLLLSAIAVQLVADAVRAFVSGHGLTAEAARPGQLGAARGYARSALFTRARPTRLTDLARLPAPLPVHLSRPAGTAQGPAVGAHQPRRLACTSRWPTGGACRATAARRQRGAALVREGWVREGSATTSSRARCASAPRGGCRGYLADVDPAARAARHRADRLGAHRSAGPVRAGSTGSTSGPTASVVVVDYKTGRQPPSDDDARSSLALALYAVAAARTLSAGPARWSSCTTSRPARSRRRRTPRRAWRARSPRPSPSPARRGRPTRRTRRAPRTTSTFPARPSSLCSWCDFRRACPQGRAAATEREPWSAVPTP